MKLESPESKSDNCPVCEFESGWGRALCRECGSVFDEAAFNGNAQVREMRIKAMSKRQEAIEVGNDHKERYYRGAVDGLTLACEVLRWRNADTDPPTQTGKILVWINGAGPAVVNVEERWMAYFNGGEEIGPTDPGDWDWWCEIQSPEKHD
jgi:hypothetical protein